MKLFAIGVFIVMTWFFMGGSREKEINRKGLQDLNLKLQGVVTHISRVNDYNGYGIITVRVLKTNITIYDPRGKLQFYFCVIKDGIAEIYSHAFLEMMGDTINIDTKRKLDSWGSKWNKETEGSIHINPNEDYYRYIRQNTVFKEMQTL
jgi:hypothetical protein